MKLLVYADLQATDGDELCFHNPNTTLQHYRVEKFFNDISRIYTEKGCKGVVDLGDTTDDRSAIPLPTLEVLGTGMTKLPDGSNWKLTGNHEQYLRDISVNNRRLFEHKFNVIDDRRIQMMGDWAAFYISYPADYAELTEWLVQNISRFKKCRKVLFGHFLVEGAFFQSGIALKGIPRSVLEPFDLVLLGHVHIPQSVTTKIHYVGSPFQQDWGEANQAKRVGIVNTNDMAVEWILLPGYPQYKTVNISEFSELTKEASEDRYRVTLNSHEETEQFFRHPHFNRAAAQYNYDEVLPEQMNENQDWTFEGACRRYLKMVPPEKVGIELTDEEMLEMMTLVIKL